MSEEQFGRLSPLLPTETRGVARVDDPRVISGIVHVLMSGERWVDAGLLRTEEDALQSLGAPAKKGIGQRAFETLAAVGGPPAELMLDSTWTEAHRSATGGKGGHMPTP